MPKENFPTSLIEQNPGVTKKIFTDTERLKEDGFSHIKDFDNRPTVLDLQGLGPESTEEDFLKWIEKETGIPRNLLEEQNTPESKEVYRKLNAAYQQAKNFLMNTLQYSKREIDREPQSLNNKNDLFRLLNKTKLVKGDSAGLDLSRIYCRLAKTTIATYEATKNDAKLLEKITKKAEDAIISSDGVGTPLTFSHNNEDGSGTSFLAQDKDGSVVHGVLTSRAKAFEGVLLRFLTRPESNAKTALQDGIGLNIVIDKDQAMKLVPILCNWLIKKMGVDNLKIENQSYFSKKDKTQRKKLKDRLEKEISKDIFTFYDDKPNSNSSEEFEVLKIKGNFNFSKDDETLISGQNPISVNARAFEIQLVLPNNKNEKGKNNHYIYDVKKLVNARTRIDGWCSETAFNDFIQKAASDSGISATQIKFFLLGEVDPPIVEIRIKNKLVYIDFATYERWKDLGFVSKDVFVGIEQARLQGQRKYKIKK